MNIEVALPEAPSRHHVFLESVMSYAEKNPDILAYIMQFATVGVLKKLDETRERAADFEVGLAAEFTKNLKRETKFKITSVALTKIQKWVGKSTLVWDWLLKEVAK